MAYKEIDGNYTKTIRINLEKDIKSFESVKKSYESLAKLAGLDVDEQRQATKILEERKALLEELTSAESVLDELMKSQDESSEGIVNKLKEQVVLKQKALGIEETGEGEASNQSSQVLKTFLEQTLKPKLREFRDDVLESLKQFFRDSIKELNTMLSSSKLSNEETRSLMFRYGLSSSQVYGYQKASELSGLDFENFVYGTAEEKREFTDAFKKYTERYSKLYDSGFFDEMQKFNYEWSEMKEDLKTSVVEFFLNNKTEIMSLMETSLAIGESLLSIATRILKAIPVRESWESSAGVDYVNRRYQTSNVNVNQENTYNGISNNDAARWSNLSDQSYRQIIEYIKNI